MLIYFVGLDYYPTFVPLLNEITKH